MNEEVITDSGNMVNDNTEKNYADYGKALMGVSTAINSVSTALMNFEFPKVTAIDMSKFMVIVNDLHNINDALTRIANDLKSK